MKIFLLSLLLMFGEYQPRFADDLVSVAERFLSKIKNTGKYSKRMSTVHEAIPVIQHHCARYDIDPLLVVGVIIPRESSWDRNAVGKGGEIGLMQVMPRYFRKINLRTIRGQIMAGVSHLGASMDACSRRLPQALTYYGANRCTPVGTWATRRVRQYRRHFRRFNVNNQ